MCRTDRTHVKAIVFDSGSVRHQADADLAPLMFSLRTHNAHACLWDGRLSFSSWQRATAHRNVCDTLTNQSMKVNFNSGHVMAIMSSGLVDPEIDLASDINYERNLSPSLWSACASHKSLIDEHQTCDRRLELTWCGIIWIAFWQLSCLVFPLSCRHMQIDFSKKRKIYHMPITVFHRLNLHQWLEKGSFLSLLLPHLHSTLLYMDCI